MLEEEEVEVPFTDAGQQPKESVRMDTDEAANGSSNPKTDVNMEDAKTSDWVDNGIPGSVEKPLQMETDNKVPSCLLIYCAVRFDLKF